MPGAGHRRRRPDDHPALLATTRKTTGTTKRRTTDAGGAETDGNSRRIHALSRAACLALPIKGLRELDADGGNRRWFGSTSGF
jgi:hypothetical protein